MAYARGFRDGVVLGLAIGMLLAPQPGERTRGRIASSARRGAEASRRISGQLQQGWRSAQPLLQRAGQAAGGVSRAVQPVAQGAGDRFVELVGRGEHPAPSAAAQGPAGGVGFDN